MAGRVFRALAIATLLLNFASASAAPREREPKNPSEIRDRIVRFIRKLPRPIAKILDDLVIPPKP